MPVGTNRLVELATDSDAAKQIVSISRVDPFTAELTRSLELSYADKVLASPSIKSDLATYTGRASLSTADDVISALQEAEVRSGLPMEEYLHTAGLKADATSFEEIIKRSQAELEDLRASDRFSRVAPSLEEARHLPRATTVRIGVSLVAMAAVFLATDCDFRPTQALENPDILNHFVLFSKSGTGDPSTYRVCISSTPVTGAAGEKLSEKTGSCVQVSDMCDASKPYCLGLAKSGSLDALNGYTLFSGVDQAKPAAEDSALFESVFDSTSAPADSSLANGVKRPTGTHGTFDFVDG
jgi:hypothetical protein